MAKKPQGDRNTGLETLLEQAQWSRTQLANAVNRLGDQLGMTLKYDHSAVSHWLSGTQPRERVRRIILEVLERRIGRPLTYAEAGLRQPSRGEALTTAIPSSRFWIWEGPTWTPRDAVSWPWGCIRQPLPFPSSPVRHRRRSGSAQRNPPGASGRKKWQPCGR